MLGSVVPRCWNAASGSAVALRRGMCSTSVVAQAARRDGTPSRQQPAQPTQAQSQRQWDFLLGTMNPNRPANSANRNSGPDPFYVSPVYSHLDDRKALSKAQQKDAFEAAWRDSHSLPSPQKPAKPNEGRTVVFDRNTLDFSAAFGQLQGIMRRNNVRSELILGDRYEKPNQKRRRLASVRHRRRFADLVRQKVQLIMHLRSRNA